MKKLFTAAVFTSLFLASCAQNKENREEFKDERNKEYMRNSMGDTAASNSESATADSLKMKSDTAMTK
ncbi:hypothetical protein EG349_18815 [Chryseobacterium shandongense]|jgi:Ni/Co efflux regulator RcnB|uniref:Cytochrome C551 n=1 Tax=Chryseobacterium shandongense TaxID=1493872 RepID=A0A3G6QGD3_9FLAO|nr:MULTISPECIES: hypothetical protein [Chryseobacterium]AZA56873.1 hypothetical protein EG350_06660 [Chryseobacterium shandongense]AZA88675.1 hypothetical protein EG349_18815 [Chryseobacterium shandongense]AZA97216.1 hypothetical protein EG353_17525 [Chryseobacterium shandongense]